MKRKLFQHLLLCGVLMVPLGNSFGQGIQFLQDEPIEKVLSMAKEKNMIVFIDGYTKSCAPCKELDKKVFPLQEVGDYFNSNFINVKYDLEEKEGIKVRAQYKDVITGFPSLILLDPNGKMIHKIGGFHPADSLITKMKSALKGNSLSAMRAGLTAGEKSLAFVQAYKKILTDGYLHVESEEVSHKILDRISDQEMLNPQMWELIGRSVTDPYSANFARVVNNYWNFRMKKVTDLGLLEYQLRTAIQWATDSIVTPVEKNDKLVLKNEPAKEAVLMGYLKDTDRFKHTETFRALFDVHHFALAGNWNEMIDALKFYNRIKALGNSSQFLYLNVQYMMQSCKDKKTLTAAADLLKSLPKEKIDVMGNDDNYNTLIKLYELTGDKLSANKYKGLQKK